MGAALAATATILGQRPHFSFVPITIQQGKLSKVSTKSAHSRNLRAGRYSEPGRIYFVTSTCLNRQQHFSSPANARILSEEFNLLGVRSDCVTLAYVVMPDHFHWLVQLDRETTLQEVVRKLKGRSARRIGKLKFAAARVWQSGFHDHAVRKEEDLENLANYLIQNPLRAGLVSDVDDYPYWYSAWHKRTTCRG